MLVMRGSDWCEVVQAQDAHNSMLAWRAAEAVRDLDGAAASIAAGQAEVRARSLLPSTLSFQVVFMPLVLQVPQV